MQLCSELPFRLVSAQLRDEREEAAETRKLVALFAYTRTIRPRQALAQLSSWPDPHWPRSKPHNDFQLQVFPRASPGAEREARQNILVTGGQLAIWGHDPSFSRVKISIGRRG